MFGNWSKRLTALVLLCTCVLNVLAVVNLGIARDQRAQAVHYHVWSSRVTYAKDTERFSNDEIYALAKVAYDEMEKLWETDVIDEWKRPAMMAAMAVGKDVYFSSSIKGSGDKKDDDNKHSTLSFIYEYKELKKNGRDDRSHVVSQKLKACQLALHKEDPATATHHNSHASCAEIMVLHKLYYAKQDKNLDALPIRIAAYGRPGGVIGAVPSPQKPCGGGQTWGCLQTMAYVKVETLPLPKGDLPPPPTFKPSSIKMINAC